MSSGTLLDPIFKTLGIDGACHEHAPVATVEEAEAIWRDMGLRSVKNLFLKDDNGAYWLVVVPGEARVDLKALPGIIGSRRLRFASAENLLSCLGVAPGAVSPLALINDKQKKVAVVLDRSLQSPKPLALHPLRNDATVAVTYDELLQLLSKFGHVPIECRLS